MSPIKHDYQKLFHAISQSNDFDEKAFLESKSGIAFRNKMPRKKNELYEKLLQNVRGWRQVKGKSKRIEVQLREQIEDILFLREKKLFEQSTRRLERAKKRAEDYNLHEILIEILRLERTIIFRVQAPGYEEEIEKIHQKIKHTSEIITNKGIMLNFYDSYFIQMRRFRKLQGVVDTKELSKLINSPELKEVSRCLSFEAESNFYFCHCIHHFLIGNTQKAWEYSRTLYLRWQEKHEVQKVKAVEYRNVLQNYLAFCNNAARYEEFDIALKKMLEGPFYSEDEHASAIDNGLVAEMQRCLILCEWEQGKKIITKFKNHLEFISERLIPSRIMLHYMNFATLFIVLKDWKNAYKWAKKVENVAEGDDPKLLIIQARLFMLISIYEEPSLDNFDNQIRSTKRLFKKFEIDQGSEAQFATELFAAYKENSQAKKRNRFSKLLKTENQRKQGSNTEIILKWLLSKAENKPLRTILEEERNTK